MAVTTTSSPVATASSVATASPGPSVTPGPTGTVPTPPAQLVYITVNSNGDTSDVRAGDGKCEDSQKVCTLRGAIEEINAIQTAGYYVITFSQPMVINVPAARPLPALRRNEMRINGAVAAPPALLGESPQAGAAATCQPGVTLNGPGGLNVMVGLTIGPVREAVVQGIVVKGFGIGVSFADGAAGNRLGSDGDGFNDAAECNVITGNRETQVQIAGEGASGNWITGNFIGVDGNGVAGSTVNRGVGIAIVDRASRNTIGMRRRGDQTLEGLGNRIQGRHFVGILVLNEGTADNQISGNLIGASARENWDRFANQVGILIGDSASGTRIGGAAPGGPPDPAEANAIQFNLLDGISIDGTASGSLIQANTIHSNLRDGLRLAATLGGRHRLRANTITANGGAAIAVDPLGAEIEPPVIGGVDATAGTASGRACAGCLVELFADAADEARLPLGTVTAGANGQWSLAALNLTLPDDAGLTATATDGDGNSSLLGGGEPFGAPFPLRAAWTLVDIAPPAPRLLVPGAPRWERRFRLIDENQLPVSGTEIRVAPLDLSFTTDVDGLVTLAIPVDDAARYANRTMSFSLEAVTQDGTARPIAWYPAWAIARQQPVEVEGDVAIDLGGLGPHGIGGMLREAGTPTLRHRAQASSGKDASRGDPSSRWSGLDSLRLAGVDDGDGDIPRRIAQAAPQGYAAAMAASPAGELREGGTAWQSNLARGGGIYELRPVGSSMGGRLEIAAPIRATNAGESSSSCANAAPGATVAGWDADEAAWLPIAGSVAGAPPSGSTTVQVTADIAVDTSASLAGRTDRAGGSLSAPAALSALASTTALASSSALASTSPITLYTVGYDITPPQITPVLPGGSTLSEWPPVLALARDEDAGVKAVTGVAVSLDGQPVGATYDAASFEIRFAPDARRLPPGPSGAATVEIVVTDGFCNTETLGLEVILDRSAIGTFTPTPPVTPTATPPPAHSATPTPSPTATPGPTGTTPTPSSTATPGPGTVQPTATATPGTGTPPATATGESTPTATAGSPAPKTATPQGPPRKLFLPWTNQRRG